MKNRIFQWSPENRSHRPKHVVSDVSGTICRVEGKANKPKKKTRLEKSIISIIITTTRPSVTPDATTTGVSSGAISIINITVIQGVIHLVYQILICSLCQNVYHGDTDVYSTN